MKEEIVKILEAFMANSFLVPCGFIEFQSFTDIEGEYRTYSNESRDYFSLTVRENGKEIYELSAHKRDGKWQISGDDLFVAESVEMQIATHYKYLEAVFNEIHSLNPDNVKIKAIRVKINSKKKDIRNIEKEVSLLEKEIEDSKKILNN